MGYRRRKPASDFRVDIDFFNHTVSGPTIMCRQILKGRDHMEHSGLETFNIQTIRKHVCGTWEMHI